jgi:hypothetical protein
VPERKIQRHASRLSAVHEAALDTPFMVGERVRTPEGMTGRILFVSESFSPGNTEYQVALDNGMGGGTYLASQLRPLPESFRGAPGTSNLPAGVTAALESEADLEPRTAADDYPEMGSILHDRPDPAHQVRVIGMRKTAQAGEPWIHKTKQRVDEIASAKGHNLSWHFREPGAGFNPETWPYGYTAECTKCDPPKSAKIHVWPVAIRQDQPFSEDDIPAYLKRRCKGQKKTAAIEGHGLDPFAMAMHGLTGEDAEFMGHVIDHIRQNKGPGVPIDEKDAETMARSHRGRDRMQQAGYQISPHSQESKYPRGVSVELQHNHRLGLIPEGHGDDTDWYARISHNEYPMAPRLEYTLRTSDENLPHAVHEFLSDPTREGEMRHQREEGRRIHEEIRRENQHEAASYADGYDPREGDSDQGPGGLFWQGPAQQAWVEENLDEPQPGPSAPIGPVMATEIGGVQIDDHGDAPGHGLIPRAGDPNGYDAESTEGADDPSESDEHERKLTDAPPVSGGSGDSNGGSAGIGETGGDGGGEGLGVGASLRTARVPWTSHERTELHSWDPVPTETDGDFVPSYEFHPHHPEPEGIEVEAAGLSGFPENYEPRELWQHLRYHHDADPVAMESHNDLPGELDRFHRRAHDHPELIPRPHYHDPGAYPQAGRHFEPYSAPPAGGSHTDQPAVPHNVSTPWMALPEDVATEEEHAHPDRRHRVMHTLSMRHEATSERQWRAHLIRGHGWTEQNVDSTLARGNRLSHMHDSLHSAGIADHRHSGGPEEIEEQARAQHREDVAGQFGKPLQVGERTPAIQPWRGGYIPGQVNTGTGHYKIPDDLDYRVLTSQPAHPRDPGTMNHAELSRFYSSLRETGPRVFMASVAGFSLTAHPSQKSNADDIYGQLAEDYPVDSMDWIHHTAWSGPHWVPIDDVDWEGRHGWNAYHQPSRFEKHRKKVLKKLKKGEPPKPVIMVARPGLKDQRIIDGHHRSLTELLLHDKRNVPGIWAWTGHVHSATGPWDEFHAKQFRADHDSGDGYVPGDDGSSEKEIKNFHKDIENALARSKGHDGKDEEEFADLADSLDWGKKRKKTKEEKKTEKEQKKSAEGDGGVEPRRTYPNEGSGLKDNSVDSAQEVPQPSRAWTQGRRPKQVRRLALLAFREAARSPSFGFEFTASWRDVVSKAQRLRKAGRVRITAVAEGYAIGEVGGDHDVYESSVQRYPGHPSSIMAYACGCPWASFHQDETYPGRLNGRPCSHAYAVHLETLSRRMYQQPQMTPGTFKRDVQPDPADSSWRPRNVVVKSLPPWGPGGWNQTWTAPATAVPFTGSLHESAGGPVSGYGPPKAPIAGQPLPTDPLRVPWRDLMPYVHEFGKPGQKEESPAHEAARVLRSLGVRRKDIAELWMLAASEPDIGRPWDEMRDTVPEADEWGGTYENHDVGGGEEHERLYEHPDEIFEHTAPFEPGAPRHLSMLVEADQANAPWGSNNNLAPHPPVKPYGATEPPQKDMDPGSYGFLAGPDPENWGEIHEDSALSSPSVGGTDAARHYATPDEARDWNWTPEERDAWEQRTGAADDVMVSPTYISPPPRNLGQNGVAEFHENQGSFPYVNRDNTAGPSTSITPRDPQGIRMEEVKSPASAWLLDHFAEEHPDEEIPEGLDLRALNHLHGQFHEENLPAGVSEDAFRSRPHRGPIDPVFGSALERAIRTATTGLSQEAPGQLLGGLGAELHDKPEPALDPEGVTGDAAGTMGGGGASSGSTSGASSAPAILGEFGAARLAQIRQRFGAGIEDVNPAGQYALDSGASGGGPGMSQHDQDLTPDDHSIQTMGQQQWSGGGADSDETAVEPGMPQGTEQSIIAAFQAGAGAAIMGGPARGDGDIAKAAAHFLRTGEILTDAEAHELITEGKGSRARNLDLLDLDGTHYVDQDEAMARRGLSLDDFDDDLALM